MKIIENNLTSQKVIDFLAEHIEDMKASSPPESKHALDIDGLKQADVRFWSVWKDGDIIACAALKKLSQSHCELKSMRTDVKIRRTGAASFLLAYVLDQARSDGFSRVSLETGTMPFFIPAHRLYEKFGFEQCDPFGDYVPDPNSVFMTKQL